MINIPKGTKDMLPEESYKWHKVYEVIGDIAKRYNLKEISTPAFEHTELFVRGAGEGSDIVNKEMYTFLDKGERSITRKPEGTAAVVRSFVENGMYNNPMPIKLYYKTPCFRYEKPQAGRLREHHQFGVEIFGGDTIQSEAEVLMIISDFLRTFGLNPTFTINHLGCSKCNTAYKEILRNYVAPNIDEFCSDCKVRYNKNILRMLDCKVSSCKTMLQGAPKITDCLCEDCKSRFSSLLTLLQQLGINYVIDKNLVRGLDYYTGLVFEIIDDNKEYGQNAIGAGGRYNNLVEELGGKSTPVIGFGLGIERLLLYLDRIGYNFDNNEKADVYVLDMTGNSAYTLNLVHRLRDANLSVETDIVGRGTKAQFKYADKLQAKYVIVIGEEELRDGVVTIKDMTTGVQERIKESEIVNYCNK